MRGSNPGCGFGSYTSGFFETEVIRCQTFFPADLPQSLSVNSPFVISTLEVEEDLEIRDINIKSIQGNFFPLSFLDFRFSSPDGPIIDLHTQECFGPFIFDFGLDDEASSPVPCPFDDSGLYQPEESLKMYNGQSSLGGWQLILIKNQENGSLDNWELEICYPAPVASMEQSLATTTVEALKVFPNPGRGKPECQIASKYLCKFIDSAS